MRPLENIMVLDLTRLLPGPFCTMMLADMGADVLRVQEPGSPVGRRARQSGDAGTVMPAAVMAADSPYSSHQRNKKSIALNLKMEESREIFYRLARGADVLVEELRPGVSRRLGIDYDTLKEINPRLIYCSVTGYGQTGPYRDKAGHDINYISLAGALSLIGEKGGRPAMPLNLVADLAGGSLHAVIGILLALLAREKTGRGQYVDISMTDGVVSIMSMLFSEYLESGAVPERGGHPTTGKFPFYNVYLTKDGKYISVGCMEPWFYANLCQALGREDLIPYQTAPEAKQKEILGIFAEVFRRKTRDEWYEELSKFDLCAGKVLTLDEVINEPQFQEREMFVELDHPEKGRVKQIGVAIKLSDTPGRATGLPPYLGEHTNEVLKGLGYRQDEITRFRQKGCIK